MHHAGPRMAEAEDVGVKSEAAASAAAVDVVAEDGVPALGEVDADLMRAPGLEARLDQGARVESTDTSKMCHGGFGLGGGGGDGAAFAVSTITYQVGSYGSCVHREGSRDERKVAPLDVMGLENGLEPKLCWLVQGNHHQPGGPLVDAVDRQGTPEPPLYRTEHTGLAPAWGGHTEQAGRLVNDTKMGIARDHRRLMAGVEAWAFGDDPKTFPDRSVWVGHRHVLQPDLAVLKERARVLAAVPSSPEPAQDGGLIEALVVTGHVSRV